jgi:DNA-binding transcriptional MerR regulator
VGVTGTASDIYKANQPREQAKFDKEKEQTRQEIVTNLKDLGAQIKDLKDAMDKQNNNGNENKMGSDFNKGVDSAIAIVTGMMTGDIAGGLAGARPMVG